MAVDRLPGYRRRIRIEAGEGFVVAQLEDDYHCMSVSLEHDGVVVTAVIPEMHRAPWTTCPGAPAKLVETFAGLALTDVTARRAKQQNCTHLHDLAVLAASHAHDRGGLVYDIVATDPQDGERILEIRRDGQAIMCWVEQGGVLAEPPDLAGRTLMTLRDWIATLPESLREPARLLQWAAIVAHGRTLPPERMNNAREMPPSCFTFQPENVASAERIGETRDFSTSGEVPLGTFGADEIERVRNAGWR